MAYGKRVVLNCPSGYQPSLDQMIEAFLDDGVDLVAVAGKDRGRVEDIIDELIVKYGTDPARFFNTTSHDSLQEALEFANTWTTDGLGEVQVVEL